MHDFCISITLDRSYYAVPKKKSCRNSVEVEHFLATVSGSVFILFSHDLADKWSNRVGGKESIVQGNWRR